MTARTVTPLRPLADPGYSDTAAVSDIHAILSRWPAPPAGDLAAGLALVLARAGRPLVRVCDIEISATETAQGWPVACAQAGDTTVYIRQDPAAGGLLVEITTKTDTAASDLAVTLDGDPLRPGQPGPRAA